MKMCVVQKAQEEKHCWYCYLRLWPEEDYFDNLSNSSEQFVNSEQIICCILKIYGNLS
jgi:hypothetical protein